MKADKFYRLLCECIFKFHKNYFFVGCVLLIPLLFCLIKLYTETIPTLPYVG